MIVARNKTELLVNTNIKYHHTRKQKPVNLGLKL